MHPLVRERSAQVAELCRRYQVKRLDVFGSAATGDFEPATSDLDFLVEFAALEPVAYKRAYFGLLRELRALFGRPVDLVTTASMRNPYFISSVHAMRAELYVA